MTQILFVGVPRSGTTAIHEQFSSHPDLAWVSTYSRALPTFPAINLLRRALDNEIIQGRGKKNQFDDRSWINRYLPRPDEAYAFWNHHACSGFDRKYLLGQKATPLEKKRLTKAVSATCRYQGRSRITAKLTGPGRLHYLHSVWPNFYGVHVVRDGLDVVRSLLNVSFWKDGGGYHTPWWSGGLAAADLDLWRSKGEDPASLAALQWRTIIRTCREEAQALGQKYIEIRYEDFIATPEDTIAELYDRTELDGAGFKPEPLDIRNKRYADVWNEQDRKKLIDWMEPEYSELGYT